MKELRFKTDDSIWRVVFAFASNREGILLIAGNKAGVSKKRFYKALIKKADSQYEDYLRALEGGVM